MSNVFLSDEFVSQLLSAPDHKHKEYFDSEVTGFYVDVLASGKKSYRVRYRDGGRLTVATLGDATKIKAADARYLALEIQTKANSGLPNSSRGSRVIGLTNKEFFQTKYLPYVQSYKKSWETDESMIRIHILPELGALLMATIKETDIAKFVEKMKIKQYAPGTINRALVLLRYGYTLAVRWNLIPPASNPMKNFNNLVDDNKLEHFITSEQANALLIEVKHSKNEMLQWIVLFLLYTGARKREVLEAKWIDVDFEQKSWRIPKTKSGKIRHVPLSAHALGVLEAVKVRWGKNAYSYIFPNLKTGLPFNTVFYSWDAARKRAGLSYLRVHDLRHSFASFLVNAGRSLYEVQEILGHSDIRTTSRYAHLSRERLLEAVEAVPLVK